MPLILDIKDKEEKEEAENKEREYREYLRKVNALKLEISTLEKQKIQYVNFKSSLSTLSDNLSDLSKNLGYASDNLSKGLAIDGVGAGDGDIKDTSILAGNYASKISSNNKLVEEKIKLIDEEIKLKKTQLLNLSRFSM
jgi:hypothetical protein